MKKSFLIFVLIVWPFLCQAQEWVVKDSAGTILNNADIDTILCVFSNGPLPRMIAMDTTKAGRTAIRPPDFIRAAGDVDLWLDVANLSGTPDSLRGWIKAVDPFSGRLSRNDSTFFLATASTFANPTSTSRYAITLSVCMGFAIVLQQGDLAGSRIKRVVAKIAFSQ